MGIPSLEDAATNGSDEGAGFEKNADEEEEVEEGPVLWFIEPLAASVEEKEDGRAVGGSMTSDCETISDLRGGRGVKSTRATLAKSRRPAYSGRRKI